MVSFPGNRETSGIVGGVVAICACLWFFVLGCSRGNDSSAGGASSGPPTPPPVVSPPSAPPQAAAEQKPEKPAEPELPEDYSQWTIEHFKQAREKQEARLFEAVAYLVTATTSNQKPADETVPIFAALMEQPKTAQAAGAPAGGAGPYGSGSPYGSGTPYGSPGSGSPDGSGSPYGSPGSAGPYGSPGSGSPYGSPGSPGPYGPPGGASPSGPTPAAQAGKDPEFEPKLLKNCVEGLVQIGESGAAPALAAINDLLEAKIEVIDDHLAVETTVKGAIDRLQNSEYEKLVVKLLCDPPRMQATQGAAPGTPAAPGAPPTPYGSGMPPGYGPTGPPPGYGSSGPPPGYGPTGPPPGYGPGPYGSPGSAPPTDYGSTSEPAETDYGEEYGSEGSPPGSPYGGSPYGPPGMAAAPRKAKMTGLEIQKLTFDLLQESMPERIRIQLASHVLSPQAKQSDRQLFVPFLMKPVPENLPVLLVFAQKGNTQDPAVATVVDIVTEFTSAVLAAVMGAEDATGMAALAGLVGGQSAGQGQGAVSLSGILGGTAPNPGGSPYPPGYPGGSMPPGYPGGSMPPGYPGSSGPPGYGSGSQPPAGYGPPGTPPGEYEMEGYRGQPGYGPPGAGRATGDRTRPRERNLRITGLPRDLALKLAPRIWTDEGLGFVEARIASAKSLKENAREVLLAATLPMDSARARVFQFLKAHSEEGPEPLMELGLGANLFADPGLLVSLKLLPREEPPKVNIPARPVRPTPGRRPPMRGGAQRPGEAGYPGPSGPPGELSGIPGQPGAGAQLSPKVRWMFFSEDVARSLGDYFFKAAQQVASKNPAAAEQFAQKRVLEVFPNGNLVAEYHLDWPNSQLRQELGSIRFDPMRIHYLRAEGFGRPSIVAGFYRRKLPNVEPRPISDGYWLDVLQTLTDGKARRQSIDVFITHDAGEISDKDEVDLVVEIISVEILAQDAVAAAEPGNPRVR